MGEGRISGGFGSLVTVAPPTMLPNANIVPFQGSKRGQTWTSASKHKLKYRGQQSIHACTDDCTYTQVLFQIANISKPLVSVSAICKRGNRVIFGRAGGVVKNIRTGAETPFSKRNGIYVLSMWLCDENYEPSFTRPWPAGAARTRHFPGEGKLWLNLPRCM